VYFSEYPGFHRRPADLARFVQARVVTFKLSGLAKHPIVMSPAPPRDGSVCFSIREARLLFAAIPVNRQTRSARDRLWETIRLAVEDANFGWRNWG
jgi:hypothetical protein